MKKILLTFLSTILIASTTSSAIACSTKNVVFIDSSLYVLSVGNGLFTFLKYDTDKAIVFDTGVGGNPTQWIQDDFIKNPFSSDFMKSQGVKEIEPIFLTHYHTDHYANLYKVDEEFKIKII
ncbi:MBL fold metallo-hydrolase [Spiroplasma taiwanense]|uniref:MBL fold metallo-hydrolase n=1 Tax=Spiroplasma taiwanense TaxID=2145 RepID=UPI0003F6F641|nr:MBL fold metallo-hydrolase [Spiroplasma taiwanense]